VRASEFILSQDWVTRPQNPCRGDRNDSRRVGLFVGWIEQARKTQVRTNANGGGVLRPTYSITVERVFEYALAHRLFLAVDVQLARFGRQWRLRLQVDSRDRFS
jgi:hypothetical protein